MALTLSPPWGEAAASVASEPPFLPAKCTKTKPGMPTAPELSATKVSNVTKPTMSAKPTVATAGKAPRDGRRMRVGAKLFDVTIGLGAAPVVRFEIMKIGHAAGMSV